jgi:hypothetical protein
MRISKSKFLAGVQCVKRLYFQVHRPELAVDAGDAAKAIINQGRAVENIAQQCFPGGVPVECDHLHLEEAVRVTKALLERPEVPAIFEGAFEYEGVLVRTDILERRAGSLFWLNEVKSSTDMKPQYAYDLGVQRYVLSGVGIRIERTRLMHLNRDYVYDGKQYNLTQLFSVEEPKAEDSISDRDISDRIKQQFRILNQPEPPDIEPGRHCHVPVLCEFYESCNKELPSDHVSVLPRVRPEKVKELSEAGINSIKEIPDDYPLSEKQRCVVNSVKSGKMFVGSELSADLASLKYPLCFMDFETVFPALPRFAGMTPYEHIPFQWSVHRYEEPEGMLRHFEYLAEDRQDPRFPFVESLCRAVDGAESIVVYNESFEYSRLDDLARWIPALALKIEAIKTRMWDLLLVMRRNVYHPSFEGSFSLKSVLPALVPTLSYETLEVKFGADAGLAWEKMVNEDTPLQDKVALKSALREYCKQDTLALVNLIDVLRKHV